jgi:branched-chain amino acid transport system substrate-binding protein
MYCPRQVVSFTTALFWALSIIATPLVMPGPSHAASSSEPIKIGVEFPLSGASASAGQHLVNGMNLYWDQIHHKMAGRPIDFRVENDETSPVVAREKVRKLGEDDNCQILGGTFMSNALYAIAPVVEKLQMPYVVVSAGADDLSQRKPSKWLVRTCYTSSQVSHPLGEYAYKTLGLRKVVCIASDYAYGYEVVGGFQQCFEQAGGQVVQKLWAPLGFKDFTPLIKSIRNDADAIFLCAVGQSAEIIPKQLKELGIKKPIIGTTASFDESFYPRMGDELVGAISSSLYSTALNTPANKKFVKEYHAKHGEDPSYFSEHGYTAAMWIDRAVESLKGNIDNKEQFLNALKEVELKNAPRGPVKLDEYGTSIDNVYIRKVERKNGKLQNTVIFTYPAVSQFWKFNPTEYLKQPIYTKDWPPCKYCQPQ